jgi:pimeloyl-[acyl-carrier protein] methyl ester esterase
LVLLHGWALNGGVFQALLPSLARHHDVSVVDLPGHGSSVAAPEASMEAWLSQILDAVPERAHWFGWSLGGMLAMEAAYSSPDRVSGLTLMATTPSFVCREGWTHGVQPALLSDLATDLETDYAQTIGRFLSLQVLGSSGARPALRNLNEAIRRAPRPSEPGLRQGLELLSSIDLRERLPEGIPTRVIAAEKDRLTPVGAGRWIVENMVGAELTEIAGAGHAPFITHPDACVEHLQS